ncbi:MAG: hypothetical protein KOO62_03870 [candidate division Zixibacteria bacterium]|nr:hypothetical protein [candidate division Zixibacteria bacterium]
MSNEQPQAQTKGTKGAFWMIYLGLAVAAIVLLGDGLSISHLERWTARIGIALLFTVLFLLVCRNMTRAITASAIIWLAVIATFLY